MCDSKIITIARAFSRGVFRSTVDDLPESLRALHVLGLLASVPSMSYFMVNEA